MTMKNHRETLGIKNPIHDRSNYAGEIIPDNYLILLCRTRDSDCLTESNWWCAVELLGGESEDIRIDRFGSWACGWFEYLSVNSNNKKILAIAEKIESDIEDYPALNEGHFLELEQSEADRVWRDCFDVSDRAGYIRENSSQFDFNGFADIRAVLNGEYFNGYASELLY